jgi:hypothetical protein
MLSLAVRRSQMLLKGSREAARISSRGYRLRKLIASAVRCVYLNEDPAIGMVEDRPFPGVDALPSLGLNGIEP